MKKRIVPGEILDISFVPVDGSGVITLPDATPTYEIIDNALSTSATGSLSLSSSDPILFSAEAIIPGSMRNGSYTVVITYLISGDTYYEIRELFSAIGVFIGMPTNASLTTIKAVDRIGGQWLMSHGNDSTIRAGYKPT